MKQPPRQRVAGLGGVFFKAKNPKKLTAWYGRHLGVPVDTHGYVSFREDPKAMRGRDWCVVWSPFDQDTSYFKPSRKQFMVNFRVADLDAMVTQLRADGLKVESSLEESEFGRFAWLADPEGNKIELWEPPKNRRSK